MSSKHVDRLSMLPEEIFLHILSLLPMKFAVQATILSKQWRHTWTLVTNLNFDGFHPIHDKQRLETFVDGVMKYRITSQVNIFRLCYVYWSVRKSALSNWINEAVRLNVRELDIELIRLDLPLSLFTCKTLTKLRLSNGRYDKSGWECPCPVNLPCLKILDITVYGDPFLNAFKLISGSPMLESLSLQILLHSGEEEYIFNIPTLKRMKLSFHNCSDTNKVVLNVPNLESLYVGGKMCSLFVMEDVSSLVAATIKCHSIYGRGDLWDALLKGVGGVKSLSIGKVPYISYISPPPGIPNMSRNVKQLALEDSWKSKEIVQVLESCPGLEHLHVQKSAEFDWIAPKLVPACMLTNLTTIKLKVLGDMKCDIKFLEYMLGNGQVLKRVTIIWKSICNIRQEIMLCSQQLLKLPRASRDCEIYVNETMLRSTGI